MDLNNLENKLKISLEQSPGQIGTNHYSSSQKQLGVINFAMGRHLEAIYNFSESHCVGLRSIGIVDIARKDPGCDYSKDTLSFHSKYSKGVECMMKRLEEMPSEWTIVQLTRIQHPKKTWDYWNRSPYTSVELKNFYLSRLPCGSDLKKNGPVIVNLDWPDDANDPIQAFIDVRKKLGQKKGSSAHIRKMRQAVSLDLERHCREISPICMKEWACLLLGKLYSKSLEDEIREIVDKRLEDSIISNEQRYLCYLLAEGSCHLENKDLESALYHVFDDNESLALRILEALIRIKEDYGGRLQLAKRHPVLLIVDDRLDNICWESIPILRRHPVSRVYSIPVVHALYSAHKDYIKDGLREIDEDDICYYIVNPDGNLPSVEEKIPKFLSKRFPHWIGIVGKIPTEEEFIKALTHSNSYVYCGHGSGSQYLAAEKIQKLKVNPLQLLYGCSSVALADVGGFFEMYGDVMEFALAKSGCTLGMLWPVTCNDTDKITMLLANICLPGSPVDINTFEKLEKDAVKKEAELLRALRDVRECVDLFSNGAALVARGIPIKLVHKDKKNLQ